MPAEIATTAEDKSALQDFLGQVTDFGQAAANIYKVFGDQPQAKAPAAPAATASSPSWIKYLPWAIGGLVLLVALGFVFKK